MQFVKPCVIIHPRKRGEHMTALHTIIIALIFNALDLVTGFFTALKAKDIQSSKLRDGMFKKFGFILCYFVAWLVDTEGQAIGFQFGVNILPVVILYACTTELVSILENISKINPDLLPDKLMEMFHINKKDGE